MHIIRLFAGSALLLLVGLASHPALAEIRLGSLSAITGPIPELVAKIIGGEEHAVEEINAAGGVLGEPVELVIADSQCDAKAAVDAANKLVNVDRVTAIVGGICSGGTIGAVQAVTIGAGVVSVSPSATSPTITDLDDKDLVYRTAPSDAYQGVELAKLARELGYDRVAMTYANDDYNSGLATVFRDSFTALGGRIISDESHEPNKPSYRSELATLARGDVQALVLFAYYDGSGITILRQSLENDFFEKFLGADGMVDQSVITEIGVEALQGKAVFTASASDEEGKAFQTFATAHKKRDQDSDPRSPYVAQGYDATILLGLAIEHAGSADRDKIARSLRAVASGPGEVVGPGDFAKAVQLIRAGKDVNYEGAAGSHDFDANGDVAGLYNRHDVDASGKFVARRIN